jgi:hypothetical protein
MDVDSMYSKSVEVFTIKNIVIISIDSIKYIFDFVDIIINIPTKKQAQKTPTNKG